jgi:hypothetical protein
MDKNDDESIINTNSQRLTIRKFENSLYDFSVVKMKLNSFLCHNSHSFHTFINGVVDNINLIAFHAYHLLNIHFIQLLENNLPPPTVFTEKMCRWACNYVSTINNENIDPPVKGIVKGKKIYTDDEYQWFHSVQMYRTTLPAKFKPPDRTKQCNLVKNLAEMMYIACKNHINLNWSNRFRKFLQIIMNESDNAKATYWVDHIMGYRTIDPENPSKFDNDPVSIDLIAKYRIKFHHPNEFIKLDEHLDIFLPEYYIILKKLESDEKKKFTLFPMKSHLIPSCIKICNGSLIDIISIVDQKPTDYSRLNDLHLLWDSYFNLKMVETQRVRFANEITTDGYSVNITMKKLKPGAVIPYDHKVDDETKVHIISTIRAKNKANKPVKKFKVKPDVINDWDSYSNHLGLDPGKRSLFTTYDDTGQIKKCARNEYRNMIGFTKDNKKINARKDNIEIISQLNQYSFKTSKLNNYLNSLRQVLLIITPIQSEYNKGFYRKLKFTRYIKKTHTYKKLCDRLTYGNTCKTLIGYGTGLCNGTNIKGAAMPVKGFYDYLSKQRNIKVIKINESYTSKMCSQCHHETGQFKDWHYWKIKDETEPLHYKLEMSSTYGLRRCIHNECRITWNRDVNAARNIHHLLSTEGRGLDRPEYLCKKRSVKQIKSDPTSPTLPLSTSVNNVSTLSIKIILNLTKKSILTQD